MKFKVKKPSVNYFSVFPVRDISIVTSKQVNLHKLNCFIF